MRASNEFPIDLPADLRQLPATLLESELLDVPPAEIPSINPRYPAFAASVRPVISALAQLAEVDPRHRCTYAGFTPGISRIPTFSYLNRTYEFGLEHDETFGPDALLQLQGVYVQMAPPQYHHPGPRVGLVLPKWTNSLDRRESTGEVCNMFVITPAGEAYLEHKLISPPNPRHIFEVEIGLRSPENLCPGSGSGSDISEYECDRQLGFPGACAYIASALPKLPAYLLAVAGYRRSFLG